MNLKPCTSCKRNLTTRNVARVGREEFSPGIDILYLNCKSCQSTIVLIRRTDQVRKAA